METSVQNGSVIFTEGKDRLTVTLHRTLRLPEDGNTYKLPPNLGNFPIKRVDDYKDKVPKKWLKHGGVFFPMWQREAMWLSFQTSRRQFACKVAAGKINAVSGKAWTKELAPSHEDADCDDPRQDYCVAPTQRWLDGFNAGDGIIKQFVAMPLGQGYTVEGQVSGEESFGGIQLMACAPRAGKLEPKPRPKRRSRNSFLRSNSVGSSDDDGVSYSTQAFGATLDYMESSTAGAMTPIGEVHDGEEPTSAQVNFTASAAPAASAGQEYGSTSINVLSLDEAMAKRPEMYGADARKSPTRVSYSAKAPETAKGRTDPNSRGITIGDALPKAAEMGLAAGGSMEQKIIPDPHGIDTWDVDGSGRMFIHIVNSEMYEQITGEKPPKSPIDAQTYAAYGYPWYSSWEAEMGDVSSSETLKGVKTISQKDAEHGFSGQQNDAPAVSTNVVSTGKPHIFIGHEVKDGVW